MKDASSYFYNKGFLRNYFRCGKYTKAIMVTTEEFIYTFIEGSPAASSFIT